MTYRFDGFTLLAAVTTQWYPYTHYYAGSNIAVGSYIFRATSSVTTSGTVPDWNFDIGTYTGGFRNMGQVGGPDKDLPIFTQLASESFESGDPNNQFPSPGVLDLLLIPDGSGGLLFAGTGMERSSSDQPIMVKRIVDPRQSDAGPSFSLPSISFINQLVVGENDTAYAAGAYDGYYGARIVAFDINGAGEKWHYDPQYGEPYNSWTDIVAALPGGGVAASVGYWQEPRVAFTLDASGSRTDAASPIGDTYVTYSGVGSDTWYSNPCTSANYCYTPFQSPGVSASMNTAITSSVAMAFAMVPGLPVGNSREENPTLDLQLVPFSDSGGEGRLFREINYRVQRRDGTDLQNGPWYVTEHQTNRSVTTNRKGTSGGDLENEFHDEIGCMTCSFKSYQTFTVSRTLGLDGHPSYFIPVYVKTITPEVYFRKLYINRDANGVEVGHYFRWPGVPNPK